MPDAQPAAERGRSPLIVCCLHSLQLTGVVTQNLSLLRQVRLAYPRADIAVVAPASGPGLHLYAALGVTVEVVAPEALLPASRWSRRPDLFVCESLLALGYALTALTAGLRVVVRVHEEIPLYRPGRDWSSRVGPADSLFASLTDAVLVFPCRHTAEHYAPVIVAGTAVHVAYGAGRVTAPLCEPLVTPFTILQLGTVYARKGAIETLEAFRRFLDVLEEPEARLVFVGVREGGTSEARYVTRLQGRVAELDLLQTVEVLPVTPDPSPFLNAASVVTLHSQSEAFPTSILEALLFGRPVVVPVVGGVDEQVIDGADGYLFSVGDVRGQATALAQVYRERDEWRRQSDVLRARCERRFPAAATARPILDLLHNDARSKR